MYWKQMQLNWNISVCTDVRLCVHMHVGVCMCVAVEICPSVQALESVRLLGVSLCHSRSPSLQTCSPNKPCTQCPLAGSLQPCCLCTGIRDPHSCPHLFPTESVPSPVYLVLTALINLHILITFSLVYEETIKTKSCNIKSILGV